MSYIYSFSFDTTNPNHNCVFETDLNVTAPTTFTGAFALDEGNNLDNFNLTFNTDYVTEQELLWPFPSEVEMQLDGCACDCTFYVEDGEIIHYDGSFSYQADNYTIEAYFGTGGICASDNINLTMSNSTDLLVNNQTNSSFCPRFTGLDDEGGYWQTTCCPDLTADDWMPDYKFLLVPNTCAPLTLDLGISGGDNVSSLSCSENQVLSANESCTIECAPGLITLLTILTHPSIKHIQNHIPFSHTLSLSLSLSLSLFSLSSSTNLRTNL